jgi:hypothetical protein
VEDKKNKKRKDKRIISFESDIKMLLRNQDRQDAVWHRNLVHTLRSLQPEKFQEEIRAQLDFKEMHKREITIEQACQKTYKWVFESPKESN